VSAILSTVNAACDNQCSGHGTCLSDDVCQCYDNWGVGLSFDSGDCSDRVCPFELAWVDTPNEKGEFHKYAECAGKGICDRKLAECTCFDGYEGKACQRTVCPNDCSGHGTCEYIEDMGYGSTWSDYSNDYHYYYSHYSLMYGWGSGANSNPNWNGGNLYNNGGGNTGFYQENGISYGQGFFDDKATFDYNSWDNRKTRGCVCDALYGDLDCSLRMCPYGTDVLDTRDNLLISAKYQTQRIQFMASTGTNDFDASGHWQLNSIGDGVSVHQTNEVPVTNVNGVRGNTADDDNKFNDHNGPLNADGHLGMKNLLFQTFALTFKSKLNETFTTIPIVFNAHDMPKFIRDIQLALLNLPNKVIDGITVAGNRQSNSIVNINITFTGDRVQGPQHYLIVEDYECQDGCTPKIDGLKLQHKVDHLNSNIAEWVGQVDWTGNFDENKDARNNRNGISSDYNSYECGRRGKCDYSTGLCGCFLGYTGANCNTLTTLV